ncbi:hypothetical protein FQN50_002977 [Emmonsiellopsis sp. PD_5]|nr:hypothetical protein FQN50_002977 [Emmonsiellopsis sp. PD_5]
MPPGLPADYVVWYDGKDGTGDALAVPPDMWKDCKTLSEYFNPTDFNSLALPGFVRCKFYKDSCDGNPIKEVGAPGLNDIDAFFAGTPLAGAGAAVKVKCIQI